MNDTAAKLITARKQKGFAQEEVAERAFQSALIALQIWKGGNQIYNLIQ